MKAKNPIEPKAEPASMAQRKFFHLLVGKKGLNRNEDERSCMLASYQCESLKEMTKGQLTDLIGKLVDELPDGHELKKKGKKTTVKKQTATKTDDEKELIHWRQMCVAAVSASHRCLGQNDVKAYAISIIERSAKKPLNETDKRTLATIYNLFKKENELIQSTIEVIKSEELQQYQLN